jgi:hypothetical protein
MSEIPEISERLPLNQIQQGFISAAIRGGWTMCRCGFHGRPGCTVLFALTKMLRHPEAPAFSEAFVALPALARERQEPARLSSRRGFAAMAIQSSIGNLALDCFALLAMTVTPLPLKLP